MEFAQGERASFTGSGVHRHWEMMPPPPQAGFSFAFNLDLPNLFGFSSGNRPQYYWALENPLA